jgi:hypothetical protein
VARYRKRGRGKNVFGRNRFRMKIKMQVVG